MFQLSSDEYANLKSQIVISGWGGVRTAPYTFTEQGIAIRSSVLRSAHAITADTALRMAAFFGMTSGFWLGLQADYNTEEAAKELLGVLAQIHRFEPAAA